MDQKKTVCGFVPQWEKSLPELSAVAHMYVHEKSGAQLLWLDCPDHQKSFSISFRTVPENDTGVFHILEHSVLCGSEHYPLREPFVELMKGSMQTFLNAFTFPDKTMYPVASTNDRDFLNLISVYMDAVFHPLIYKKEEIFMQEGWHYTFGDDKKSAGFSGVVLNEMKGAFASPERAVGELVSSTLLPDTCYARCSGGDPSVIPTLRYDQFLDAHRTFYHPENSYIFLYGDIDRDAVFSLLDRDFLAHYTRSDREIPAIGLQKPFGFRRAEGVYEASAENATERDAIVSDGYMLCGFEDKESQLAMNLLCGVLAGTNESPLKKAVLEAGLGEEFAMSVYDGIRQPFLRMTLKKARAEDAARFTEVVHETVRSLCRNGIDRSQLSAALSRREFELRERDFDGMPAGIIYAIDSLSAWLYGGDPTLYLTWSETISDLREKLQTSYFEDLLERVVLGSDHHVQAVLTPSTELGARNAAAEVAAAEQFAASGYGGAGEEGYRSKLEALRLFGEAVDSPEALATIPHIAVSDIERTPTLCPTTVSSADGRALLLHPTPTNGIAYYSCYFDLSSVAHRDLPYVSLLCSLLGDLPTGQHSAWEVDREIQDALGFFSLECLARGRIGDATAALPLLALHYGVLEPNLERARLLVEEILTDTVFDRKAVGEILRQEKLELDRAMKTSGQAFALSRVRAARTPDGRYEELMSGCSYAVFVGEAVRHFDQEGDAFCVHLAAVAKQVFGDCAVTLSLGADAGLMDSARAHLIRTGRAENLTAPLPLPEADRSDVCVRIVGGVSYDAMCSTLSDVGGEYSGALRVAARAVSLGYLWNAVRVRGGAYGVGASFTESGVLTFYSYRDPHIGQTYRAFEGAGDYLRNYSPDESELAKLIVGAAATLDRPKLPKDEVVAADYRYFLGLSDEMVLRRRAQLLDTDCKTLHAAADLFDRLCGKAARCTVGAGTALDRESDLFDRELKI